MKKKLTLKRAKNELCPICSQEIDMCVTSHKNRPFIDNKLYSKMCFTCYSVPKIIDQKYDEKGYIIEEKQLEYSHKNLHNPEEIFTQGSADSLEQAKKSVRSVKKLIVQKETKQKEKSKPKLEFYMP
jgi:hypothetical protein